MFVVLSKPRVHLDALAEVLSLLKRHRQLLWEMTKRELTERHAGQMFGSFWALGQPLILIAVYVFAFSFVFKCTLSDSAGMPLNYTSYLLSGLIPWIAFQDAMTRSVTAIAVNANLVKQVVFPIELLPLRGVLIAMATQALGTTLLLIYVLAFQGSIPWTYLFLPLLWLAQLFTMSGFAFVLSSIGTYFRDIKELVHLFVTVGMFVTPISYLPQWVPALIRPLLYLNPFSYLCWCYQDLCFYGRLAHPWAFPVVFMGSLAAFCCGYRVFRKLKTHFGSVL
jgi:lipopolysaccharide transport system permease protein